MGLIDTHAHLTYPELKGRLEEVFANCDRVGVARIITIGTDVADAQAAISLSLRFPDRLYVAAGIHPHHSAEVAEDYLLELHQIWMAPQTVAVGEIGLDYHYDYADRAVQRRIFAKLLDAARPLKHPLIIHCREAADDLIPMLCDAGFEGRNCVFHCFTGSDSEAQRIAEHGWRISFTGIVTFKNSVEIQQIARNYPLSKLMVETDSPYLSPAPVRGKNPNEPANVAYVAQFLANLRGESFEELSERTTRNAVEFFGLNSHGIQSSAEPRT